MMKRTSSLLLAPLVTTTLLTLACEAPPHPAAPKWPSLETLDGSTDRVTGGGKLDRGRDFATFGFNARPEQGQIEWVQHCLDGASSDFCSLGSFTFHGSTVNSYGTADDGCRTWSGTGEAKFKDPSHTDGSFDFTAEACDHGHPGRDNDSICFALSDGYVRAGTLTGGNIQQHEGATEGTATECSVLPLPT